MKLLTSATIAIALLAGCAMIGSNSEPNFRTVSAKQTVGVYQAGGGTCSTSNQSISSGRAGTLVVPKVPNSGNFGGSFYQAPVLGEKFKIVTVVESCSFNVLNLPIPTGFQADWFGSWRICRDSQCSSFTFGPGQGTEVAHSSSWRPGVTYYMYVYAAAGQQLIESYSAGTVEPPKKKGGSPYLEFASPFQKGFIYPANDRVGLEIVHTTQ